MQIAPLLRASEVRALRELIKAAPVGFPYPGHGPLACVKGVSRGDAETRSEVVPAAAQPVPSAVYPASPVDRGERPCGAAQPLRVSAAPRAKPSFDGERLVAAFRAEAERRAIAPRVARALPEADSPEECRRCGIPGRKGCAHQAPYVAAPIAVSPYTKGERHYG